MSTALFPVLCLLQVTVLVNAQAVPRASPAKVPAWAQNRIYSFSSRGLMSPYFSGNTTAKRYFNSLLDHFKTVDKEIAVLNRDASSGKDNMVELCTRVQAEVVESVAAKASTLGFGVFKSNCISELPASSPLAIFRTISGYGGAVAAAGKFAMQQTKLNWTKAYTHYMFEDKFNLFKYSVVHAVGFRIRGKWATSISKTEYPVNQFKSNPGRRYLVEYIRPRPDGTVVNMFFRLPKCTHGQNNADPRNKVCDTRPPCGNGTEGINANCDARPKGPTVANSTTSLEEWRGIPTASFFRQLMPLSENPAVSAALRRASGLEQQALDSTTASSIAILMLTATLTLVPVAAIADVTLLVTVAYTVFTDLLACMPVAIKGIELVTLSRLTPEAAVSWVYGIKTDTDIGIAETWAAQCIAINSTLKKG